MRRPRAQRIGGGALLALVRRVLGASAGAQVRQPEDTISAGEHSGPLRRSAGRCARQHSVHDRSMTVGEASVGSVRSGPVRDAGMRSMLSGPVSEMSRGPVSEPHPPLTGGSVAEASAGAVKHDIASPLGERISDPLRELAPLQKQMRALREQAEQAALAAATEAVAPPADEAPAFGEIAAPEESASADAGPAPTEVEPQAEPNVDPEGTLSDGEGHAPDDVSR